MSTSGPVPRPVTASELPAALASALAGGPPVAPLPPTEPERSQTLALLSGPARSELSPDPDQPVAAVVTTSGSSGRPKAVMLSAAALRASADGTHERLGGPGDWVLALPEHYVAGLMVLTRASVAGTRVDRVPPDLTGLDRLPPSERRYVSLVPTQLTRACASPRSAAALADCAAVLVGGAPARPDLLDRARGLGIRVVTTYGMSETCGGCVYDGSPLAGVDVRLDPDGRVTLAGPTLFCGYWGDPVLTAATVVDGRLQTADRGRWVDGRLEVTGRFDEIILSGGHNVDLAEIQRLAENVDPGLAVVGLPDPEWGTVVAAATEGNTTLDRLQEALRASVPAWALPRRLAHLDRLPRTSSGKIDRVALRRQLSEGPA